MLQVKTLTSNFDLNKTFNMLNVLSEKPYTMNCINFVIYYGIQLKSAV